MRRPLILLLALAGCATEPPSLGDTAQASTVAEHVETSCTTAVVIALSRQIAGEVGCMVPGQLVSFAEGNGIVFAGGAVLPYVSEVARTDLYDAVAAGGGRELQLTSVYRTVVQQYLLYRWLELHRCGITAAAPPGDSNHESGRAIDVSNWSAWIGDLAPTGWAHDVPGDDVHFDHTASPDLRGTDVLAFQRLWNRNMPGMPILEDGDYGPMTAMAIAAAPAEGFAIGPGCAPLGFDATLDRIAAPRELARGAGAHVSITVRNTGSLAWPTGTALVTGEPLGRASALADPSWPSPSRAAVLPAEVAVGGTATFELDVLAPDVAADTELTEVFTLEAGADHFGTIALVVTITDGSGDASGGCAAGGGGSIALALVLLALIPARRRRAIAALAAGLLAIAPIGSARAQHCRLDVPERATLVTRAARPWWASVATAFTFGAGHVRDESSGFVDTTRSYQGATLVVAAGWRRLGARLALGGYRVDGRGVGPDDLRGAVSLALTPPRGRVRAGVSAAATAPSGASDDGRGMGHVMVAGGAWARVNAGRIGVDTSVAYARALGDDAAHAAHLHGSDLWPLIDPTNAVEIAAEAEASYAVVPRRLALRGGLLAAFPVERGARRLVAAAGLRLDRGRFDLIATISRPLIGDPFVARGQLEVGYQF